MIRAWIGWSRRWWGGEQRPPSPAAVVVVGRDESDGAALDAVSGFQAAGGAGNHSRVCLLATTRDLQIEALLVRLGGATQEVSLSIDPDPPPAPASGISIRGVATSARTIVDTVALASVVRFPVAASANDPVWLPFGGSGVLLPAGSFMRVIAVQDDQPLAVGFFFREAA